MKNTKTKYRFNKYDSIGTPDAESDLLLEDVYVDNGELKVLLNTSNDKSIIVGRTGTGKSALIKLLEKEVDHIKRINPESISIKYLSNSTIINYLISINVNLNLFYKVLWKHVFLVELIKLYLNEDKIKKDNLIKSLIEKISNSKKKIAKEKAINYLEKWSDEFWLKEEHRIKELEHILQEKVLSKLGLTYEKFNLLSEKEKNETLKVSSEVKSKAEQVINEIQAEELYETIDLIRESLFQNDQKKFYIILDDLDKEWVAPQMVYDLIASMIEVIKEFRNFKGVKIIVGLRDNLHQLVFAAKEHRGGQREKFSSLYLNLKWEKNNLKYLINNRLSKITNDIVKVENIFENVGKNKVSGFDYVIERTFYRPRDIISYINKIISHSHAKSNFTTNVIKLAEHEYSLERLNALEDEWGENYGDIRKASSFLIGIYNGYNIGKFKDDSDFFAKIYLETDFVNSFKGNLHEICINYRNGNTKFKDFIKEFLYILYRIGIIGLKCKNHSVCFFYDEVDPVTVSDFDFDSKIYVHKCFYSVFKINVKEQEATYLD